MKKRLVFGALLLASIGFTTVACSDDSEETGTNTPITGNPGGGNDNPGGGDGNTSARFQHRVLIEDATGTWCQFCPRVSYAIQQVKGNATHGDKIVAVAIHQSYDNNGTYDDPMEIPAGNTLINMYGSKHGLTGFPFGLINRTNKWTYPEPNNLAQAFNAFNAQGSPVGIKISSNLTTSGGTITAEFRFSQGYQDLKYSVFVVENNVITPQSPQSNTTEYYNGQGANFVHNDVLRAVSGTATGNDLGTVTAGQNITKENQTVTYNLFNNDLTKVEVIVFVTDASGKVLNVQSAHANATVDYQIIN